MHTFNHKREQENPPRGPGQVHVQMCVLAMRPSAVGHSGAGAPGDFAAAARCARKRVLWSSTLKRNDCDATVLPSADRISGSTFLYCPQRPATS